MIRRRLESLTGGLPAAPLVVLFLLNAVDELDRSVFNILAPEIRDAFGLDNQGVLTIVAVVGVLSLGFQPLIGFAGDKGNRSILATAGGVVLLVFGVLTGLAPLLWVLVLARIGSAGGRLFVAPIHLSLLADHYPPDRRPRIFGAHYAANSVGQIVGPLAGGLLAAWLGWRAPFLILPALTLLAVVLAVRYLNDPVRGRFEREAAGADEELAATEEAPPSIAESWRTCNQVRTLRRIWISLPFLVLALVGLVTLTSIFYEDVFGVSEAGRGLIAAIAEPFQLVGILIGTPITARLMAQGPDRVLRALAVSGALTGVFLGAFALAPTLPVAVACNIAATSIVGALVPGINTVLSLVIPPRARAMGYAIGSLYYIPGFILLVVIGGVADGSGVRIAMLTLLPIFLIGAALIASAGAFVDADIANVRASSLAKSEVLASRRRGESKLLLVKDLDVAYDGVQVLFGVDFEVDEGEIIALLGTNGAGKSTLLRAISGLQPAVGGAVIFDGVDMTYAPPQEIADRGVIQVPGGKGVFPELTVAENLRIAGWLNRKDADYLERATEQVLEYFPVLRARWDELGGNLSGGEQQMLTLGQAFIARPRLLMIDELSLGLAPTVVEQLLGIVRAIRDRGTTIIVVEQSVNVALTLAETAYFLEKGEVRFKGDTRELLNRPDVLRSVFLEGASSSIGTRAVGRPANGASRPAPRQSNGHHDPVLSAVGLTRSYGGITAVNEVSFDLERGEILGVIGPNGAGKTTLFDLLSGFTRPDSGRLLLEDEDVSQLSADARAWLGLGRSFQDARLFPSLTVAETIAVSLEKQIEVRDPVAAVLRLPAWVTSEADTRRRTDELLAAMGLEQYADKFISELSTGTRRVVDLACIAAQEPKVILFDEPSSGIAQRETEALAPLLLRFRDATRASLIVIEHDMPLITDIADRLLALDLGRVVTSGAPDDVVSHPEVVAAYLGTDGSTIARSGPRHSSRRRRTPLRAKG